MTWSTEETEVPTNICTPLYRHRGFESFGSTLAALHWDFSGSSGIITVMSAPHHLSGYSACTGTSTLAWRFRPCVSTAGLEKLLKLRSFAGYHPEDTIQCRVAAWQTSEGMSALLSPPPGMSVPALACHFERLANLYFLELVARGWTCAGGPVRWLLHWPARADGPAPHHEDRFERVWVTPWAAPISGVPPARAIVSAEEALAGFAEPGDSRL